MKLINSLATVALLGASCAALAEPQLIAVTKRGCDAITFSTNSSVEKFNTTRVTSVKLITDISGVAKLTLYEGIEKLASYEGNVALLNSVLVDFCYK
jgi:hypothetical protein